MNNLHEKSEQHDNDITVNTFLLDQHDLPVVSCDPILKCETQQWNIKSEPYLHPKHLTPGLSLKSEQSASTLNLSQHDQQYHDDKAIVSTQCGKRGFLLFTVFGVTSHDAPGFPKYSRSLAVMSCDAPWIAHKSTW